MRTFAFACAVGVVAARHTSNVTPEPVPEVPAQPEMRQEEPTVSPSQHPYLTRLSKFNFYAMNIWNGCYQGLYGMGRLDDRPSEECFGEWIVNDMIEVNEYLGKLKNNMWEVTYEDSMQAAYD